MPKKGYMCSRVAQKNEVPLICGFTPQKASIWWKNNCEFLKNFLTKEILDTMGVKPAPIVKNSYFSHTFDKKILSKYRRKWSEKWIKWKSIEKLKILAQTLKTPLFFNKKWFFELPAVYIAKISWIWNKVIENIIKKILVTKYMKIHFFQKRDAF